MINTKGVVPYQSSISSTILPFANVISHTETVTGVICWHAIEARVTTGRPKTYIVRGSGSRYNL